MGVARRRMAVGAGALGENSRTVSRLGSRALGPRAARLVLDRWPLALRGSELAWLPATPVTIKEIMRNFAVTFAALAVVALLALAVSPLLRRRVLGEDDAADRTPAPRRQAADARD